MSSGYLLDFSNASFANFFRELNIDIYDAESYPGFGDSKANRMRALWKSGTDAEIAASLHALAEYLDAKKAAAVLGSDVTDEQVGRVHDIARGLSDPHAEGATTSLAGGVHASFTTERLLRPTKFRSRSTRTSTTTSISI